MSHNEPSTSVLNEQPLEIDNNRTNSPFRHRQNGFDLLRHVAALMVIFGHAFPLTGTIGPGYLANGIHTIAVKIFFVASGFLILRSWQSDPSPARYFIRRILRLMPALLVVTMLSVFVLGPIFTTLSMPQYFGNPNTWRFLYNMVLYPFYNLPGVFTTNKYPYAVNGSLWTLPVEFTLYLIVPLIAGASGRRTAALGVSLAALLLGMFMILYIRVDRSSIPYVIYGTDVVAAIEVGVYFLIGAVYAVFGLERFSRPLLSLILLIIPAFLFYNDIVGELALLFLLPFAVVSIGTLHLGFVGWIFNGQDLSYGLYLYAFPIQQTVQATCGNSSMPYRNFVYSAGISVVLAWLSWNVVEKRALSLKPARRSGHMHDLGRVAS